MAGETLTDPGSSYSPTVGFLYTFNLIVGTGALTLPKAFAEAGYVLGTVVLASIGFISYISATFVVEAMSNANAVLKAKKFDSTLEDDNVDGVEWERREHDAVERSPLINEQNVNEESDTRMFQIKERVEMGQMAALFYTRVGTYLFYVCIVIYLYGDLAIYATAVPKTLRDVACTFVNGTGVLNISESDLCWSSSPSLSRKNVYRIFVASFAVLLGPFMFLNVQKTKYLQVITSLTRWGALSLMIILAVMWIIQGRGHGEPKLVELSSFSSVFGISVYAFMCHHSLPGVLTPIKRKKRIHSLVFGDFFSVVALYMLLALTGVFLYKEPRDLYTLNFFDTVDPVAPTFIRYFLALFPVFTLSSTFPIVGITLRNNIRTLFSSITKKESSWAVDKFMFPLITLIPPIGVALITNEVQFLVGFTGSYAGCVIQYIVPATMVYCSRRMVTTLIPSSIGLKLPYQSPFRHVFWIWLLNFWAVAAIVIITVNHIVYRK